jgi:tRNA(Ser,Leu) C12 N-acetylase TAN1
MTVHASTILVPVNFMIYNLLKFGKAKGQVDPRSVHYITLMRDPSCESIADTINRLTDMFSVVRYEGHGRHQRKIIEEKMTQRFKILSSIETDAERKARYERDGLEVISVTDGVTTVEAVQEKLPMSVQLRNPIKVGDAEVETLLAQANL